MCIDVPLVRFVEFEQLHPSCEHIMKEDHHNKEDLRKIVIQNHNSKNL